MRINNLTNRPLTLNDFDRGCAGESKGIYLDWNAKSSTVVDANSFIDVLDTERVMLSTAMGEVSKLKTATLITTQHSMTGNIAENFDFPSSQTFQVQIGSGAVQSFNISGTGLSATSVVSSINATATGFTAEKSNYFFRSSFVSAMADKLLHEGPAGFAYGERSPSLVSGFIVLVSSDIITIGHGPANAKLGFIEGNFTKAQ